MVAERLGRLAARLVTAVEPATTKVRATEFAQKLKAEYERGLADERSPAGTAPAGDSAATAPPTDSPDPTGSAAADGASSTAPHPSAPTGTGGPAGWRAADGDDGPVPADVGAGADSDAHAETDDLGAVTAALKSVDWAKVRAATAEHASGAKERMRSMAADVDWGKVQAGAAVVSSALIAAVASGQLPLGGRLAGPIARAILNDSDLSSRVSSSMAGDTRPPDLTADVKP